MIGIGTILSIVGGISETINIYKFGSTLAKGSDAERVLGALDRIHATVERLSDNILYAPGIEGLSLAAGTAHRLGGLREARALLEPVQVALGGEIVSSGLVETPHKMERAMLENPWAMLEDIRPQHLAVRQANPDKVPVLFVHQGVRYIGWQMRGALPVLFNCELRDLPGLGAPLAPEVREKPRAVSIQANQPLSPSPATGTLIVSKIGIGKNIIVLLGNSEEIGRLGTSFTKEFKLQAGHVRLVVKSFGFFRSNPLDLYIEPNSRTSIEIRLNSWNTKLLLVRV